jgi:hypothetical protein
MRIKENEQLPLSVAFKDRRGGSVAGPENRVLVWESSDENVASVKGGADGALAMVTPRGPGRCQISARTEDGNSIGTFDVDVDPVNDIDLVISAGRPIPMTQEGRRMRGEGQPGTDDRPLEERVAERSTARGAERGDVAAETHQNRPARNRRRAA